MPSTEEISSLEAGLALHIPYRVFEILLSRDADLYQRMSRTLITELAAQMQAANEAIGGVSDRRADLDSDSRWPETSSAICACWPV